MTSHSLTRIPREPRKVHHYEAPAAIDQEAQPAAVGGTCQEAKAVTNRQLDFGMLLLSRA